jgi:hypothetical protein
MLQRAFALHRSSTPDLETVLSDAVATS